VKRIIDQLTAVGIGRRGGTKTGWRYLHLDTHKPVRDPATLDRIRHLAIPPAWRAVAVNPSATHRVQAVGQDDAGRWQYLYHEAFRRRMEQRKFHDLLDFARRLPTMRRHVAAHLRHDGLTRERVLAGMIRILDSGMIRVGCDEYAHEHRHFGLATLQHHHVRVEEGLIHFNFTGKCGEHHHINFHDRAAARLVHELLAIRGSRVFRYLSDDGRLVNAGAAAVNDYFKTYVGRAYSVKDFRTWVGTVVCACALGHVGPQTTRRAQNQALKTAILTTAETLGNTPAVCKSAYVAPRILDLYLRGMTVELHVVPHPEELVRHCHGLHPAERATLHLLTTHGHG
jgi:DNA topoisomerase-1